MDGSAGMLQGFASPAAPSSAAPYEQQARDRRQRGLAELAARSEAALTQVEGSEASPVELQATLDRLRADAASLGVDASQGGDEGPSRGRGRGRGAFWARGRGRGRGRGSMTWTPQTQTRSFKLDLRPRALEIELEDEADVDQTKARLEVRCQFLARLTLPGSGRVVGRVGRLGAEFGRDLRLARCGGSRA